MRTQQGVDPAMFDNPEVRFSILQQLIRERLIEKKGRDLHFARVQRAGARADRRDPRFQDEGKFSLERYKLLLAQAGISEAGYEDSMRRQILAEKLVDPIASRQHRRQGVGGGLRDAARAAARSRGREHRRGAVRQDVEGRRSGGEGVLRRQPGRVPDAGRSEIRVRDAHSGRARRAGHGDAGRGEGAVRSAASSSTRRKSSGRRRTS